MSFVTPILFVFYLQVMPPPPTMNGGASLWSGYTVDNSGNIITTWNRRNLNKALKGENGDPYRVPSGTGPFVPGTDIGYNGLVEVLNAVESRHLVLTDVSEWGTLINRSKPNSVGNLGTFIRACGLAENPSIGGSIGADAAIDRGCVGLPLPKGLSFFSVLSFLIIYYLYSREDYSNFGQIKHSE